MGKKRPPENPPGELTTYTFGLYQAKAYRMLKRKTTEILRPYRISSTDWALLGLLYAEKSGMRLSSLASELGVEAPFVTKVIRALTIRGFVRFSPDPADSRAKRVTLTPEGHRFVPTVEAVLRKGIAPIFKGISSNQIGEYMTILIWIVTNAERNMQKGQGRKAMEEED